MTKLSDLPPLREVIRAHDLRAEKKLGQNFLLDGNLTDKIARQAGDLKDIHVIEVGPGPGGLTRSLLKSSAVDVTAIEYDPRAIEALQDLARAADGRLRIIQADALEIDIRQIVPTPRVIVANLPYNIATPLLIGWLEQIFSYPAEMQGMVLMFQKEVAERIVAKPSTKAYGRLSIICQWLCDTKICLDVPPSAFTPPPKVTSSIVKFTPRILLPTEKPSFSLIEKITAMAFGQRRKMIRSSLQAYKEYFVEAGLDETLRAENVKPEDYVRLALCVEKREKE